MEFTTQNVIEIKEKLKKAGDDAVQSLFMLKQNGIRMKELFDEEEGEIPAQFDRVDGKIGLVRKDFIEFQK